MKMVDVGGDVIGILLDDDLWGNLFVVFYVEWYLDFVWVVESDDGWMIGYIVVIDDIDMFYIWFWDEWWLVL